MNWSRLLWAAVPTFVSLLLLNDAPARPPAVPGLPRPPSAPPVDGLRAAVVRAALGETGRINAQKYWDSAAPGVAVKEGTDWCGAFVLWALHEAGLARGIFWNFGTGFELKNLPQTNDPKPGDIAYFDKLQHRAIVERVDGDQISLINGNGESGAVSRSTISRSEARAFFSIADQIQKAEA
jgi:hypothetical protein